MRVQQRHSRTRVQVISLVSQRLILTFALVGTLITAQIWHQARTAQAADCATSACLNGSDGDGGAGPVTDPASMLPGYDPADSWKDAAATRYGSGDSEDPSGTGWETDGDNTDASKDGGTSSPTTPSAVDVGDWRCARDQTGEVMCLRDRPNSSREYIVYQPDVEIVEHGYVWADGTRTYRYCGKASACGPWTNET